ncbi:Transcription initiation factor TFIID subunit 2 [Coniosporium apollinis]|uniref:Transcription initiation factor TFIID subunit 2 n=1 Tax=Coniosporium apollinis TaxID=61459 RepID=A0ABQ9P5T1_9PEZI|nr:Transcription initiation factor TFIID subunit 2 [Coniosporium apollinis]
MPGLVEPPLLPSPEIGYSVGSQKVELDIDFARRSLKGKTEILIYPRSKDIRTIRLNCRQCTLTRVTVQDKAPSLTYDDPYTALDLRSSLGVQQHHILRERIEGQLRDPPEEELIITIPKSVRIEEVDPMSAAGQALPPAMTNGGFPRAAVDSRSADPTETPVAASRPAEEHTPAFTPITVHIEYVIEEFRDGLHFVGFQDGDTRYPHVYTRSSAAPGTACSIFPCIDEASSRQEWDISIRCPRTLGDAFPKPKRPLTNGIDGHESVNGVHTDGATNGIHRADSLSDDDTYGLTEEERAMELAIVDPSDPSRKTVSFHCSQRVAPRHIGFAIGPFEHVNLSEFRESDEDEKMGQSAIRVHGFCLPDRADEVKNTCMTLAKAIDYFTMNYGSYPFTSYKVVFVDDLVPDIAHTASLSICSNRLLFPEKVLDPLDTVTQKVVHALACQWIGVYVTAADPTDSWIIVGGAHFMTDMFLLSLCGKNEIRHRQKMTADKVVEMDVQRPSLHALGPLLSLDSSELEFMKLKAPMVMFIMHQRMVKASGRNGVNRILWKVLLNAKVDQEQRTVSTAAFLRVCEKVGHMRLEHFFNQWVHSAGCPQFYVQQRFNKKKLVVEMVIKQTQSDDLEGKRSRTTLTPDNFLQEAKEEINSVYAGPIQPLFTGPMTIRIHEADGTPYEHIVEIKEVITKVEIPYNTKYKRLKRSRRQKERAAAATGLDVTGDAQDDVLLYCLGDVLQSEEEVQSWKLADWSNEEETKMQQESYEWIRMDADFEWITKVMINMPHYMYVSQLQQDKDVVAQVESIRYLSAQNPHPLISSILTRTLMDGRYFHGIRTAAAAALAKNARDELEWIGLYHLEKAFQELFCLPGSPMTRSNDFSDRSLYLLQCAIPRAIAKVRDNNGKAPMRVKRFFIDKLKFNDNSNNEYSDDHYVATLMYCLAESLTTSREPGSFDFSFGDDPEEFQFRKSAINEIERYRRIDEWTPSYHNIFTVTALKCFKIWIKNRIIPRKADDLLQYTRPSNADEVRIEAFDTLIDLGMLRNRAIMSFLLYNIETDYSPHMRDNLWRIFWRGLGQIALGEGKSSLSTQRHDGGLIIEQDMSTENRAQDLARTQSAKGAMDALKAELGQDQSLQTALRNLLTSPLLSLQEFADVLELCGILYDPHSALIVTLKYPRYWKCEHLGNGKLKFSQTNRVRTKMMPRAAVPEPAPQAPPPLPKLVIKTSSTAPHDGPPPEKRRRTSIASAVETPAPQNLPHPPPPPRQQQHPQVVPAPPVRPALARKPSSPAPVVQTAPAPPTISPPRTQSPEITRSARPGVITLSFKKNKNALARFADSTPDGRAASPPPAPPVSGIIKGTISKGSRKRVREMSPSAPAPAPAPAPAAGSPAAEAKPGGGLKLKLKLGGPKKEA